MGSRNDRGGSRGGHEGELDLPGLVGAIRRRKWWVILPTLAALAGSGYVVQVVKPRYTAETRILIESRDGYYTRPTGSSDRDTLDEQHVQSQVLLVSSRDAARQVVERLKLRGNPEFDPTAAAPGLLGRLAALIGGDPPTSQEAVVDKFLERTTIYPAQRSRVITIEFSSSDAELAAKGANALADAYIDAQEAAKQDTARAAGTWLQGTIEPLRAKLAETEAKVEAYRAKAGLLMGAGNATLQQQQLADLNSQLTAARTAEADAKAKADLLREALRGGRPLEISEVANNEFVRRLMGERATVKAQIALESRTLLPGHPRIKELNAQLAELDQEARAAAEKTVKALENDSLVSAARVASLTAAFDRQKRDSAQGNEDEVQLRALEREAKSQRDQLETYMARYREATARENRDAAPADARIISRASVPATPSFPKKGPIVLVSTLGMAVMSLTLVATRALLTGRRPEDDETEDETLVETPAGMAPPPPEAPPVVPVAPPPDPVPLPATAAPAAPTLLAEVPPAAEARRNTPESASSLARLAERVAGVVTPEGQGVVAMLCGPDAPDVAERLAQSLSRGLRVVLVEPAPKAGSTEPGFADLCAGTSSFFEGIRRHGSSRLHRIGPGRDQGVADAAAASEVIAALRHTYDIVAMAAVAVPRSWAPLADIVVVTGGNAGPWEEAGAREVLLYADRQPQSGAA
jgi:succinoglycan biosynthesis transport protein ExoP